MPERIQLRREKGWRMPPGAVKVDRSTMWGNPWIAGRPGRFQWREPGAMNAVHLLRVDWTVENCARAFRAWMLHGFTPAEWLPANLTPYGEHACRRYLTGRRDWMHVHAARCIGGRDLACWCALDQPCHADTLLRIAND